MHGILGHTKYARYSFLFFSSTFLPLPFAQSFFIFFFFFSFAGTSTERDFVECPSQALENWCWEKEILERVAFVFSPPRPLSLFHLAYFANNFFSFFFGSEHHETKEKLPSDLIEKMLATKNVNTGLNNLRQVFFGLFDQTVHSQVSFSFFLFLFLSSLSFLYFTFLFFFYLLFLCRNKPIPRAFMGRCAAKSPSFLKPLTPTPLPTLVICLEVFIFFFFSFSFFLNFLLQVMMPVITVTCGLRCSLLMCFPFLRRMESWTLPQVFFLSFSLILFFISSFLFFFFFSSFLIFFSFRNELQKEHFVSWWIRGCRDLLEKIFGKGA